MPDHSHKPHRPDWKCRMCDMDWPCVPGRDELTAGRNRVQLAMIMWSYLKEVAADLPGMPAEVVAERFIKWTGSSAAPRVQTRRRI